LKAELKNVFVKIDRNHLLNIDVIKEYHEFSLEIKNLMTSLAGKTGKAKLNK